jgi:hypothetical protein
VRPTEKKTPTVKKMPARAMLSSAALVLACACGVLASCGAGSSQLAGSYPPQRPAQPRLALGSLREASSSGGAAAASAPFRFFSPSSFWNTLVPASSPLASNSTELVSALDAAIATEEQSSNGPWIDTTSYSVPIYTVPANQPTVRVTLDRVPPAPALQSAFAAVPLPPNAQPAIGTDSVLVVWQPSSDRLWEFWRLVNGSSGWRASWGGAMQNVSSNPGVYGPHAWPGAKPWWGSSASSMSIAGGLITLEDLQFGRIDHALAMAIPEVRTGVYVSPAQRGDGKSRNPLSLPEGTHLRLNRNLDLAALHLPHLTAMIAEAAQRYGIFVRDTARNVTFYAQDPIPTGANPFLGPTGYFEGRRPSQLLMSFPWNELQVVKMSLHRNRTASQRRRPVKHRRRRPVSRTG